MTNDEIDRLVAEARENILDDVAFGLVPLGVNSLAELNSLGTDTFNPWGYGCEDPSVAQKLDAWIRDGGIFHAALTED